MTDRHRELPPIEPLSVETPDPWPIEPLEPLEPVEPLDPLPVEPTPPGAPGVIVVLGALIDAPLDPVFDSPVDPVLPAAPLPGPAPLSSAPGEPGTAPPVPPPCAKTGAAAIKTVPIVYSKTLFIRLSFIASR